MSTRAISEGTDGLAEARARLAESLRASRLAGATVSEALLTVLRHVFLPQESAAQAYEDTAIVIKSDADGLPVSASTQPVMMAIMLEQLEVAAGHRVLEIGTGTGCNAALIAKIVGDSGSVVTISMSIALASRTATDNRWAARHLPCSCRLRSGEVGPSRRGRCPGSSPGSASASIRSTWPARMTPGGCAPACGRISRSGDGAGGDGSPAAR